MFHCYFKILWSIHLAVSVCCMLREVATIFAPESKFRNSNNWSKPYVQLEWRLVSYWREIIVNRQPHALHYLFFTTGVVVVCWFGIRVLLFLVVDTLSWYGLLEVTPEKGGKMIPSASSMRATGLETWKRKKLNYQIQLDRIVCSFILNSFIKCLVGEIMPNKRYCHRNNCKRKCWCPKMVQWSPKSLLVLLNCSLLGWCTFKLDNHNSFTLPS